MTITCIWNGQNILGESPVWDARQQLLYWVDIEQAQIHCLDPIQLSHQNWQMPSKPGSLCLRKQGGLIVALRHGFSAVNLLSGEVTALVQPINETDPLKFNDGKCDRQGYFWAGTADIKEAQPLGSLYKLSSPQDAQVMDHGFIVSNGIGWSPDNTKMYFTDSGIRTIYQYDFDATTSSIRNKQILIQLTEKEGYPDGLTVDSEGYIWSALWDGWCVKRLAPNGKVDRTIPLPIQRPTSCCFGGADLSTLFVTSARRDLTEQELAKGPQAGGLFAIETNFKGIAEPVCKL